MPINRRSLLKGLLAAPASLQLLNADQSAHTGAVVPSKDWVCPMDPDYRSDKPGKCPRCGMTLRLGIPDRVEYSLEVTQAPELLRPNQKSVLTLRAVDPVTQQTAKHFEIVHEKLIHFFVISENLQYFAHIHPTLQADGSFTQEVCLPYGGMYRLLADFYPAGSVPQLATGTIFVAGDTQSPHLTASTTSSKAKNLTAHLQLDPVKAVSGFTTRLLYTLDPSVELQPYLGAWAHMLAASEDLVDLIHVHPFLADGGPRMQFNIIFPRSGLYRVWAQFQRANQVNTTVFTIPVTSL